MNKIICLLFAALPLLSFGQDYKKEPPQYWDIINWWGAGKPDKLIRGWKLTDSTISTTGPGDGGIHISIITSNDTGKSGYFKQYRDTLSIVWGYSGYSINVTPQRIYQPNIVNFTQGTLLTPCDSACQAWFKQIKP